MTRTQASVPPARGDGPPAVLIVGGGLAGLAAAVALVEQGCRVTLVEARRTLGGRAGAYVDPATGDKVDHCQHVGMGCCTNWLDFCRRTGIDRILRRDRTLHFIGPDGTPCDFTATAGWPAPLHLGPAFLGLAFLPLEDRLHTARLLLRLAGESPLDAPHRPTIGDWLTQAGVSRQAREQFWGTVLVSALGETLDRASLPAARKVFVDGFLAHTSAYELVIPTLPLGQLYDVHVAQWLTARGANLRLGVAVDELTAAVDGTRVPGARLSTGETLACDQAIVAVPWKQIGRLIPTPLRRSWPELASFAGIAASPISAAHLWYDRPWFPLEHAVLVGRLGQWIFARPCREGQYLQIVISASRAIQGQSSDAVVDALRAELAALWPRSRQATLLRARLVTQREAVFSCTPGLDAIRPPQETPIANLFVAGDWTRTQWPATMEGAVRSGYLAAQGVLRAHGRPREILLADLPRSDATQWLWPNA